MAQVVMCSIASPSEVMDAEIFFTDSSASKQ
jgi:hypothetical protein